MNNENKKQVIDTALRTKRQLALKLLKILFCLHAFSLGISLIKYLPVPSDLTAWASRILSVGMVFCLFSLGGIHSGYRFAGAARVVVLAQNIVFALLPVPVLVSWNQSAESLRIIRLIYGAVMVLSWVATWFEYRSHGALASVVSKKLAMLWIALFAGSLLVSVLSSVVSWGVAYLTRDVVFLNTVNSVIGILSRGLDVLCLCLLYKLMDSIRKSV